MIARTVQAFVDGKCQENTVVEQQSTQVQDETSSQGNSDLAPCQEKVVEEQQPAQATKFGARQL